MTTARPRLHLLAIVATLGLALSGCAAITSSTSEGGGNEPDIQVEDEGLPTAEDLGAEDDGGAVTSGVCAPGEPDCEDMVVEGDGGSVSSGMCAEDTPDCEDMIVNSDGSAAGSCLAGDEDCTDESYGGGDVARAVRLSDEVAQGEELQAAERGATSGATGRVIQEAALVDDDTVRLVVIGSPCMLVEDVLVDESPGEVRVLVLAGQDATVEACTEQGLSWSVDIDLDQPMGDRILLDLAG